MDKFGSEDQELSQGITNLRIKLMKPLLKTDGLKQAMLESSWLKEVVSESSTERKIFSSCNRVSISLLKNSKIFISGVLILNKCSYMVIQHRISVSLL